MTRDQILAMAREAGFHCYNGCADGIDADLERFAALVADVEREACAEIAEVWDDFGEKGGVIAEAIRARKDQP